MLTISGLRAGDLRCTFAPERGYVCPGTGPIEGEPFAGPVRVELEPGPAFTLPPVEVVPGAAFTPDAASGRTLVDLPIAASSLTLGCATCGEAAVTIVRVTTTDAPTLGPTDMPAPQKRYLELSCATVGGTSVTLPAPALALLQRAHAESPITRIRTALMRDGFAQPVNASPPNRATIAVGRGVIGYSNPR